MKVIKKVKLVQITGAIPPIPRWLDSKQGVDKLEGPLRAYHQPSNNVQTHRTTLALNIIIGKKEFLRYATKAIIKANSTAISDMGLNKSQRKSLVLHKHCVI